LIALLLALACAQEPPPAVPVLPPPVEPAAPVRTIADVRASPPEGDARATIRGFVSKVYACPDCPEGAACKPCMGDNIVVSDTASEHETYSTLTADRDIIVLVKDATSFSMGQAVDLIVTSAGPQHDRVRLVTSNPTP
jgi:hypothetical protein